MSEFQEYFKPLDQLYLLHWKLLLIPRSFLMLVFPPAMLSIHHWPLNNYVRSNQTLSSLEVDIRIHYPKRFFNNQVLTSFPNSEFLQPYLHLITCHLIP